MVNTDPMYLAQLRRKIIREIACPHVVAHCVDLLCAALGTVRASKDAHFYNPA